MPDLTKPEEAKAYIKAATSDSDWNKRVDEILKANGGYPSWWHDTMATLIYSPKTYGED